MPDESNGIARRWPIVALIGLASWLAPHSAQGNAITEVDQSLLAAIRIAAPPPPVSARDIALVGIAAYDAVNAATGLNYRAYSYAGGAVSGRLAGSSRIRSGLQVAGEPLPGPEVFVGAHRGCGDR